MIGATRVTRFVPLLLLALAASPASAGTWVLDNVNVIDLRAGAVREGRAVVIEDGRIRRIGPAGVTAEGAEHIIDGRDGWLVPGLAEMHAHVPSRGSGEQRARDVLTLFLANGVTTIRGMLGEPWHLELRELLASGEWEGPRLITSGPSFNGRTVTSPEQAAQRVREQAAAGYDFLKIHPGLSREEFRSLAATASKVGIPIAGHVSFETGLEAALAAGQDSIDHLDSYAEAMLPADSELTGVAPQWFGLNLAPGLDVDRAVPLAQATARAGVWNVPTQSLLETTAGALGVEALEARPGMNFVSGDLFARWRRSVEDIRAGSTDADRRRFLDARRALIRELQRAGAGLLLGSDAPQIMNVPGFSVHQELAYLVAAGLTPLEALQTGTLNVARYFGFEDQGLVEPGFVADLVLLERNPLEDIAATTAIAGVIRSGRWHGRGKLDALLAEIEKRGL